jgi:hypothetical protein
MQLNYAVSKMKPRVYVFFSGDVPLKVRANPLEWATWLPVESERIARIGESPLSFCARNQHKHRIPGCNICSHQRMLDQSNAAAG